MFNPVQTNVLWKHQESTVFIGSKEMERWLEKG